MKFAILDDVLSPLEKESYIVAAKLIEKQFYRIIFFVSLLESVKILQKKILIHQRFASETRKCIKRVTRIKNWKHFDATVVVVFLE